MLYRKANLGQRISRVFSTASSLPQRSNLIFGANTDVGKTLVSAGLVRAALGQHSLVHYIKPLQCGGSDADFVRIYSEKLAEKSTSLKTSTLYRWETPASPHTASLLEGKPCSDDQVIESLRLALESDANVSYIETAGGVLSPSSASPQNKRSGPLSHAIDIADDGTQWGWSTQGDLYQSLVGISPVVLVGDGRLGGISCTLSALESLVLRGYDVAALILINNQDSVHQNMNAIQTYLRSKQMRSASGELMFTTPRKSLLSLPPIPEDPSVPLDEWFESADVSNTFSALNMFLHQSWKGEMDDQHSTKQSSKSLWGSNRRVVDSSKGRNVRTVGDSSYHLDAINGRWEHGDVSLGLAMASAISRYGNQSSELTAIAPKLALAEFFKGKKLIFADMEAAIRMGIKTYQKRMKESEDELQSIDWIVAGQEDCYHGHSLGSLCIAEEYFDRDHPWYESKSLLMAPPTISFQEGVLQVEFPTGMDVPADVSRILDSSETMMDVRARSLSKLFSLYKEMIEMQWLVDEHSSHRKVASVVLEPLLLTSGTIKWVDPLWQRAMVAIAETRSIPCIYDESSTGLYRLGVGQMSEILGLKPDITVFSNRSSLFPTNTNFCVTSQEVFRHCKDESFLSEWSFEASGAECNSSLHILSSLKQLFTDKDFAKTALFTDKHAKELSSLQRVRSCMGFGSLLSVSLGASDDEDEDARHVAKIMEEQFRTLVRQTGNSVLVEVSPWTSAATCDEIVEHLRVALLMERS